MLVPFSKQISLINVLYVPSLNCTFISVSKILKQTKGIAMFTETLYVLQDRSSRMLIGRGEKHNGVYYFTDVVSAKIHSATSISTQTLWHQRVGHPSFRVLSNLDLFSGSSSSAHARSCDVCFRAKQTIEVFSRQF